MVRDGMCGVSVKNCYGHFKLTACCSRFFMEFDESVTDGQTDPLIEMRGRTKNMV